MRYGQFDDTNREYVITRPDTPLPWINYLGSEAFFGLISNTAGGYTFYQDARLRRITRYYLHLGEISSYPPGYKENASVFCHTNPWIMIAEAIVGHGEAKNFWLSGTAAWNYVAITQWILGIRPTLGGLRFAPVIPADWPGFKATRLFRGVTYHITVERAGARNVISITVDGDPVERMVVPLPADGRSEVRVRTVVT